MSFLTGTSTLQQLGLNPPGSWEPVALGYLGNAATSGVSSGVANTWTALQTFAAAIATSRITGSGGTAPTAVAGATAGGGAPAPVVQAGTSDFRGFLTFGTGTAPAAGSMIVVTFGTVYTAVPAVVILIPTNAATAALQPYVSAGSLATTGWTLSVGVAPAASQANTTYGVMYVVIA